MKKISKREIEYTSISNEDYKYRMYMCKKCKFYDHDNKHCNKNRIPRLCAKAGLKNKD